MQFLNNLIGNTPMIKIKYKINGKVKDIYTKLEYYNLTGSIKDRVAYYIINNAKERGLLKENMPIIEATSGNTGISLASIGKYYGHKVYIFMPDWASKERIDLMKSYGANVILVSKEEGGFKKAIEKSQKLTEEINGFLSNQFSNKDNFLAHYETTASEIINKMDIKNVKGFVSGVGTGGTLMGIGKRLKEENSNIKIVAIEPDKMPIISGGKVIGNHKIEGIGDEFVPSILEKEFLDEIFLINDDDAVNMSRKLASNLGLGVGISSGANFIGAVLLNEKIGGNIVTIFADDNKKYLSTDLTKQIDGNEEFISNKIELLDYMNV